MKNGKQLNDVLKFYVIPRAKDRPEACMQQAWRREQRWRGCLVWRSCLRRNSYESWIIYNQYCHLKSNRSSLGVKKIFKDYRYHLEVSVTGFTGIKVELLGVCNHPSPNPTRYLNGLPFSRGDLWRTIYFSNRRIQDNIHSYYKTGSPGSLHPTLQCEYRQVVSFQARKCNLLIFS